MKVPPTSLPYRAWHQSILDLVETLSDAAAGAPAAGTVARFHFTLDTMRAARAIGEDIAIAERVSLTAHRLDEAVRSEGRTSFRAAALRRDQRRATLDWLSEKPLAAVG